MLHAVRYVKAAGGLGRMLDVEGGAQQDRFPGGTQQIAVRMAEELGDRVVLRRAGAPHRRHADGTRDRHTDGGHVDGGAVVVAIPPEHRAASRSAGPAARVRRARPSTGRRATSARPTPPTRPRSGGPTAAPARRCPTRGRCSSRSTSVPSDDGPGILLGFTDARTFDPLPPTAPRTRAGGLRGAVRRRRAEPDRLRRPPLGRRGIRAGRPDRGGAAGLVDDVRAVAAQTGRRHLLGGHRNRRPVDRLPRRRGAVGAARGRRGGPGAGRLGADPCAPRRPTRPASADAR